MRQLTLLIAFLLIAQVSFGHTCSTKKVKCPIDKTTVEFCVSMSMTTFGSFYDFQKKGAMGSHYADLIKSCPKCRYSGRISDFDTTFTKDRAKVIKVFLSNYKSIKIDNAIECMIAGELKEFLNAKYDEIADCYLIGSYLVRSDSERKDFRIKLQRKTKDYLIKAMENEEYEDPEEVATINYLIAEMLRRTGAFEEAIIYFDRALDDPNKKQWVEEVGIKQKEMAIENDDNNGI